MNKSIMSNTSSNSLGTRSGAESPAGSQTNWVRVDALSEAEIDTSEIPSLTEEDFARSEWRFPAAARSAASTSSHAVTVEVTVDEDTLAWFHSQGQDYPQRMRAALRLYAEAHQAAA